MLCKVGDVMRNSDDKEWDIIDEDLYEELSAEEMLELLEEERRQLLEKEEQNEKKEKNTSYSKMGINVYCYRHVYPGYRYFSTDLLHTRH